MTTLATKEKEQSLYAAAFGAFPEERGARSAPLWVKRLRENAMARFERLGFPTTDDEEWKYTNVAAIARSDFALAAMSAGAGPDASAIARFVLPEAERSRLVFVNGIFRPELSALDALPSGLVSDLSAALAGEHEAALREHLGRLAEYDEEAFTALNTAFLGSGALVSLPQGVELTAPVHLLFLSAQGERPSASFPRILIVAGRDSRATIIESYASLEEGAAYFTNSVAEVYVGEGAHVTHYRTQHESEAAFHISATRATIERAAGYDLTTVTLGAQLSRHNVSVKLDQPGAECWVDGLYLVGTGQHADTHSLIDHLSPHCNSHQLYKGILDGKSRAVFNGKVFVHRDAQQTDAQQTNKNLLLSNEARVDTKPQLEIFADDVKCSHGATVGQLEDEEVFYLLSRGLHPELARNLLTYGFAEELVAKIKLESIRARLDEAILNRLRARLEV